MHLMGLAGLFINVTGLEIIRSLYTEKQQVVYKKKKSPLNVFLLGRTRSSRKLCLKLLFLQVGHVPSRSRRYVLGLL